MKQLLILFVLTIMISATLRQADRSKQLIGKWQYHYTIQKRGNQVDTNYQVDEHGHQCGAVITFNGDGTGTLDFGFGNIERTKWNYHRADNSVHYQVYLDTNVVGHKLLIQVGGKKDKDGNYYQERRDSVLHISSDELVLCQSANYTKVLRRVKNGN